MTSCNALREDGHENQIKAGDYESNSFKTSHISFSVYIEPNQSTLFYVVKYRFWHAV